jgi:acyl-CoA reductase-like NAD-dependent aldehyde dehydrogenase
VPDTPAEAYAALRAEDDRDGGLAVERRRELLQRLETLLVERRMRFVASIDSDFGGRSPEETLLAEVLVVRDAIRHARRRVRSWARPRRVGVTLPFWPGRARIVPQPLGVVGVVSPWNYPVQLALWPLVGALSAGNRVALKPSELTPRTAAELDALVAEAIGPAVARTVHGDAEIAAAFVRQPFDHLLFTGSSARGREVMRAAAEHLTPLTLELGGKCPAIVLPDADLDRAAAELILGKGMNAGQSCIAPDYLLAVGGDTKALVEALRRAHECIYPRGLPTKVRATRLVDLPNDAQMVPLAGSAKGTALSLASDVGPASPLLREEVFGPVLPLVACDSLDDALRVVRSRPAPLAVYLFTRSRYAEQAVLNATRAGALVVNGTIVQAAIETLPFGGVGASGFGRYHGRAGFDTFSNARVHLRPARMSLARLAQPHWSPGRRRLIERLLRR